MTKHDRYYRRYQSKIKTRVYEFNPRKFESMDRKKYIGMLAIYYFTHAVVKGFKVIIITVLIRILFKSQFESTRFRALNWDSMSCINIGAHIRYIQPNFDVNYTFPYNTARFARANRKSRLNGKAQIIRPDKICKFWTDSKSFLTDTFPLKWTHLHYLETVS